MEQIDGALTAMGVWTVLVQMEERALTVSRRVCLLTIWRTWRSSRLIGLSVVNEGLVGGFPPKPDRSVAWRLGAALHDQAG